MSAELGSYLGVGSSSRAGTVVVTVVRGVVGFGIVEDTSVGGRAAMAALGWGRHGRNGSRRGRSAAIDR